MSYQDKIDNIRAELKTLRKAAPGATKGFGALSMAVAEESALEYKHKEWVALGMAVIMRCEPCIVLHVEGMMKAGGTREELSDILGMALQMGGGPAMMYAAHALACWDELAEAQG